MENSQILVTGYAKHTQGLSGSEIYDTIALGLVIDCDSGQIVDVDCSLVTQIARDFVKQLVIHKNINDVDAIEEAFNSRYYGAARKALILAIRVCSEKYRRICAGEQVID